MITDINSEDRLVQQTFAAHLDKVLGWNSVYAHNAETFGPNGTGARSARGAGGAQPGPACLRAAGDLLLPRLMSGEIAV